MKSSEPGKFEGKVYRDLCRSISARANLVEWDQYESDDWDKLCQTAIDERVAPLLFKSLQKSKPGFASNIPEDILNQLRIRYYETWFRNEALYQELEDILKTLESGGIEAVVLKGACLATSVYPDFGLRPMSDLDILVQEPQITDAVRIVGSMGYFEHYPSTRPDVNEIVSHHVKLKKTNDRVFYLELHTYLIGGEALIYSVPVDWFWEQTEPFSGEYQKSSGDKKLVNFVSAYQFNPSAQLMHLCAHAVLLHGLGDTQLIWLYDIHALVEKMGEVIDWRLVSDQAKIYNWSDAVNAALTKVQGMFDTDIPSEVLSDLEYFSDERLRALIDIKSAPIETRMVEELYKLIGMSWRGRIKFVSALVFPSPDFMRWRYQPSRSLTLPFFYLVRWKDIFIDGLKSLPHFFRILSK